MDIKTTRFGNVQIKEADMIKIADGVLGFPHCEDYIILEHDTEGGSPFKWLQAVSDANLAFVVVDPRQLIDSYDFELDEEAVRKLGVSSSEDVIPIVIVKIAGDEPTDITANLRGPIIINAEKRRGCQIVLNNDDYAFDHPVFSSISSTGSVSSSLG
jgi:flagellar assembly factor FliW